MKKYAVIAPSSMGVRIAPENRQPVATSDLFRMQATSAETNVLSISAGLGKPVKVLTTFVKDSPIASFIKGDLRRRGIDYEGKEVPQGGPWGYRHQFNIADSGYGLRAPRVTNDRAGEVGRTLTVSDFDLDRIFGEEGCEVLHLSGLICALSPDTGNFCLQLARAAKKYGTKISFDLNYRASFWKGREEELGGKEIARKIESFKGMVKNVKKAYPNATTFATTLRQVVSANEHLWGAIVLHGDEWTVIEPRSIPVLDRIGGGDGFVGGLIYGFVQGWEAEKCAQFAWASGAFVTTLVTDFGLPADEKQIWDIWAGNARVQR